MRSKKHGGKGPGLALAGLACLLLSALAVLPANAASSAGTYDAAADFSATTNPNGPWSYGWSASRGSAFTLFGVAAPWAGLDLWHSSPQYLGVFHNGTSGVVSSGCCNPMAPGALGLHPGPAGENAIVRWSAPAAGRYSLQATFSGLDMVGTSTDVAVLNNGKQLFTGEVTGWQATQTYSGSISALAGDTIDFTVGFGTDSNYYYDTTGLAATIITVSSNPLTGMSPAEAAAFLAREPVAAAAAQVAALDPSTAWKILASSPALGVTLIGAMPPSAAIAVLLAGIPTGDAGQDLAARLNDVKSSLSDGDKSDHACHSLDKFRQQLQKSGQGLPVGVATFLLQAAAAIRTSLGCSDQAPAPPEDDSPPPHMPPAQNPPKPVSHGGDGGDEKEGGRQSDLYLLP